MFLFPVFSPIIACEAHYELPANGSVYRRQSPRIMVFKDHASKLLKFSRMAGDEYVPSEEDPDIIMATLVPIAMKIVQSHLGSSTFCDRFSTPLTSVARQVETISCLNVLLSGLRLVTSCWWITGVMTLLQSQLLSWLMSVTQRRLKRR